MRLLLPCLLSAVLAAGLAPTARSEEPMLSIEQVDAMPYGASVYGYSTLSPGKPTLLRGRLLGVLHNATGAGHNLIAVELLNVGVIAAGQSGSPMYVDVKGKRHKIGTLSYAEQWANRKHPICYLTPIHEVLNIAKNEPMSIPSGRGSLSNVTLLTTLRASLAENNPLRVMLDSDISSGVAVRGVSHPVAAGDVLGVQLAWGDFDLTSYGTVSHVEGKRVFMFGHPFLQLGPAEYRLVPMKVLTVQEGYRSSRILAAPIMNAEPVGVIVQDRETGIYGELGRRAENAIPVHIDLTTSAGERKQFTFYSIADTTLAPLIIGSGISTAIQAWSREIGDMTLFLNGKIEVEGVGEVEFSDSFTSIRGSGPFDANPMSLISKKVDSVLSNRFSKARIKRVSVETKVFDEYRKLTIESASVDRPSFKPGETLTLRVALNQPLKDTKMISLSFLLPSDLQYGVGKIVVGDAETIDAVEKSSGSVVNLISLVESLNAKRRPDAVYIYVVLPPSKMGPAGPVESVPLNIGDIAGEVRKTSKRLQSNVEEYQVVVGDFQVSGRKEIEFKVGASAGEKPPNHP